MHSLFYFLMLALFITHELDAVRRHEWRLFPVLSSLPERVGEQLFVWLHVPLFAALFYVGAGEPTSVVAFALSIFSILHIGLHWLYRNHARNEFNNFRSWTIIVATGVFGTLHLLLTF